MEHIKSFTWDNAVKQWYRDIRRALCTKECSVAHKIKNKLICNVFAEDNAFTVMMRLSDRQYQTVYDRLQEYARDYIANKYPCGDGGWIHYHVISGEHLEDIKILLTVKCSPAKQRKKN